MTCGCERTLVLGPYKGPDLDFDEGDFSETLLGIPQGSWNNPTDNFAVLHTFRPDLPEDCCVVAGVMRVEVKRESLGGLTGNDSFIVTHAGGTILHSEQIWTGANVNLSHRWIELQLDSAALAALNGGTISFLVEDDTTALCTELCLTLCCTCAHAALSGLNSCSTETVDTEPWGPVEIPIYGPKDLVLVDTSGTCVDGDGYFIELEEFNPVLWVGVTPIFSGWVAHQALVPKVLNLADYLPPGHRSATGGFNPGYYGFKLAVGTPWSEAHYHFKVN